MLWYKAWLDTRWRFLIGLGVLTCSAGIAVVAYPRLMELVPLARTMDTSGAIGERIREGAELMRNYRGYVWSQWIRQSLTQMATVFAVLLGTGGLLSQTSGGASLFTLSMPASRTRLLGVRATAGLAEFLVIAVVPLLLLPVFSPAVGQTYSVGDALVHGLCLFVAGTVFFSLATLLSTVFGDIWRPLLIALAAATFVGLIESVVRGPSPYGIFGVMNVRS